MSLVIDQAEEVFDHLVVPQQHATAKEGTLVALLELFFIRVQKVFTGFAPEPDGQVCTLAKTFFCLRHGSVSSFCLSRTAIRYRKYYKLLLSRFLNPFYFYLGEGLLFLRPCLSPIP